MLKMSVSGKQQQSKGDVKVGSNCIICGECQIVGDVTIGNGTIIHPKARIIAESGPIVIGEHNLIEDKSVIINKLSKSDSDKSLTLVIGNYNVFEVGSRIESLRVGDYNVFEAKSFVGRHVVVSNNCIIGAGCCVTHPGPLAENSAFYGPDCVLRTSKGHQTQVLQMDFLSKLLPNYHYLKEKKKSGKGQTSS